MKYLKLYEEFEKLQQPFYYDLMTNRLYLSDQIVAKYKASEIDAADGVEKYRTNINLEIPMMNQNEKVNVTFNKDFRRFEAENGAGIFEYYLDGYLNYEGEKWYMGKGLMKDGQYFMGEKKTRAVQAAFIEYLYPIIAETPRNIFKDLREFNQYEEFFWQGGLFYDLINKLIKIEPSLVGYLTNSDQYLKQKYNSIYKANRTGII